MAIPAVIAGVATWKLITAVAGLYGTHLGLQGAEALGQYGIQKRQIEAAVRGQQLQAGVGKREEKRMGALVEKLLAFRKSEKKESRRVESVRMGEASRERQTAVLMGLMQSMAGLGSQVASRSGGGGGVPSSYLSLLR